MHSRDVMLLRKNISRNYYYCDQDENSLGLCFKSMYLTLIVAIFTSSFIFSMFKSFHTYSKIYRSAITNGQALLTMHPTIRIFSVRFGALVGGTQDLSVCREACPAVMALQVRPGLAPVLNLLVCTTSFNPSLSISSCVMLQAKKHLGLFRWFRAIYRTGWDGWDWLS